MMRLPLALVGILAASSALAVPPPVQPAADVSSANVAASGSTKARTLAAHFADVLNVRDGCGAAGAVGNGTTDDSPAFAACVNLAITKSANGSNPVAIYIPPGNYLIKGTPIPTFTRAPVAIIGDGSLRSVVIMDAAYVGDLFSWDECWSGTSRPFNGSAVDTTAQTAGPTVKGIAVFGNRTAAQNAFMFYDRNQFVLFDDVTVEYVRGHAIGTGSLKLSTEAYIWESHFYHMRFRDDGDTGAAVFDINSTGINQAANEVTVDTLDIYAPYGTGLWVHNNSSINSASLKFFNVRVEGIEGNPTAIAADLVKIGDATDTGITRDVSFFYLSMLDPYANYAAFHTVASGSSLAPYNIKVYGGNIGGGTAAGNGVRIDAGYNIEMHFSDINVLGTDVIVGASPLTAKTITVDCNNRDAFWTWNVDSSALSYVRTQPNLFGVPNALSANLAVSAQVADGSQNFGNARGSNAVDWQTKRSNANQVASGANSVVAGGNQNRASASGSAVGGGVTNTNAGANATIAWGANNLLTGQFSATPGGNFATDRGDTAFAYAAGEMATPGDAQYRMSVFRAAISSTAATRLTTNGQAAASTNGLSIPVNAVFGASVQKVVCIDTTNSANWAVWRQKEGAIARAAASASYTGDTSTATAPDYSGGAGSAGGGATLQIGADATNQVIALSVTWPTANLTHCSAVVSLVEVQ